MRNGSDVMPKGQGLGPQATVMTWDEVDVRRRMMMVRAGYAQKGEAGSLPLNQLLTDILKSVKLADYQADRLFGNLERTSYRSFRSAF